jgi:hypothetical protein
MGFRENAKITLSAELLSPVEVAGKKVGRSTPSNI